MIILAFDKLGSSLNQTAINLKWHRIQYLPISPTERVKEDQLETILDYNLNDTLITGRLYEELTPIREMRNELSKIYSVDLSSASDSRIANLILEHVYSEELRMDIRNIRDMRTWRDNVILGDCIAKFVEFKSLQLREVLSVISSTYVYQYNNYKYSHKIHFANCVFALGVGGLHTEDAPGVFVSDKDYLIQDMDVSSYYPNLIINNNFYPEHLGKNFITVLKKITEDRLEAKKQGDKVKADGLKITVNSIFGKMGSETFWLLDAKQMLSTTLSGQLGLLMLVEDLHEKGIEILSCNTDGVVCKIPRKLLDTYYEVAKNWEKKTNLTVEFSPYKKYVRRDVNSYITEKEDGSTKEKGAFQKTIELKRAYRMPIVAKALHAYFIEGKKVRETLEECKDIMDFCISQKSGANFIIELHKNSGIEQLQKTNRFYISKKGGRFIKRDRNSKKLTGLHVGRLVQVLNVYDSDKPFEEYEVDLSFYEKEVMKIVDEIEPKQMTLFEFGDFNKGAMVRQDKTGLKVTEAKEEDLSVEELNKLGKNQFIKKIESIVGNHRSVNGISPRYVFVKDVNPITMMAEVYCLSKGLHRNIAIDKKAYKKENIKPGTLVYCTRFDKKDANYTLAEYRVTEKIEQEREELL